jgi:hypothetical protein
MGIYTSGNIFGISIYNFNEDECSGNSGARNELRNWQFLQRTSVGTSAGVSQDESNTLFEQKYGEIMSHAQMREAYLFYNELYDKNNILFKIYTECSSTLNKDNKDNKETFMMWCPMSLDIFLEKFSV